MAVSTRIQSLSWSEKNGSGNKVKRRFRVYEFDDTSAFLRETIPAILDKRAGKDRDKDREQVKRVTAIVEEIHAHDGDIHFIGDNLKQLDLSCTHSHEKAKGSNKLEHKDVVTFLQYLSPQVYARLCLWAEEYVLDDIVRTYYRDMLFQAIGRNRSFRRSHDDHTDHHVVMSPNLYKELGKAAFTKDCRYELILRREFWK
jgi:hypothetical protein